MTNILKKYRLAMLFCGSMILHFGVLFIFICVVYLLHSFSYE